MSCAFNCGKWLLFIFNFIFALCGLACLIVGVLTHLKVKIVADILEINSTTFPTIGLIIVGAVIFIIAFFGCCGAIRENHCMIVTFAMLLLTILVIQLAVGIFAFVNLNGIDSDTFKKPYTEVFDDYWLDPDRREVIDLVQSNGHCCGLNSWRDFGTRLNNNTVPWSCCHHEEANSKTPCTDEFYSDGCLDTLTVIFQTAGKIIGAIAIGIAVAEFIGIIFALCLANSVRNAERRGYRV